MRAEGLRRTGLRDCGRVEVWDQEGLCGLRNLGTS